VSFAVAADAYDRFMGRYSVLLAPQLVALAGAVAGQRVLDVGCGPGALTTELVRQLGPAAVTAVDPSGSFVAAARERHPGVAVERASAEQLPFADQAFDAALAQLVVHFMADPVAGLREAVLGVCELQAADRGISKALAGRRFVAIRERLMPSTRRITERAQSSGRMRSEFSSTDFGMLLWLGDAVHEHAGHVDGRLWRRYVEALLDGLLSPQEPRRPLSVAALDFERMDVVVRSAKPAPRRCAAPTRSTP